MTTFFEQFKKPDEPESATFVDDDEADPGTPMAQVRVEHAEHVGPEECEVPK